MAAAMTGAKKPWWVIGSAAVVIHGAVTPVADVDVLLDLSDVAAIFGALDLRLAAGRPDALFRSSTFARWTAAPLPVEFMADLRLRDGAGWSPLAVSSRIPIAGVFVPDRAELGALMRRFGRDKDLDRAALLDAIS